MHENCRCPAWHENDSPDYTFLSSLTTSPAHLTTPLAHLRLQIRFLHDSSSGISSHTFVNKRKTVTDQDCPSLFFLLRVRVHHLSDPPPHPSSRVTKMAFDHVIFSWQHEHPAGCWLTEPCVHVWTDGPSYGRLPRPLEPLHLTDETLHRQDYFNWHQNVTANVRTTSDMRTPHTAEAKSNRK